MICGTKLQNISCKTFDRKASATLFRRFIHNTPPKAEEERKNVHCRVDLPYDNQFLQKYSIAATHKNVNREQSILSSFKQRKVTGASRTLSDISNRTFLQESLSVDFQTGPKYASVDDFLYAFLAQ